MMCFCFVLEQKGELDVYSASSLKQQSTGRHTLDDVLLFVLEQKGELDDPSSVCLHVDCGSRTKQKPII
jgi:hypothetical protein